MTDCRKQGNSLEILVPHAASPFLRGPPSIVGVGIIVRFEESSENLGQRDVDNLMLFLSFFF